MSSPSRENKSAFTYTADEEPVVQAVIKFLKSSTYEEKRVIVAEHPELLTPKAEEILVRLVALHRQHGTETDASVTEAWHEFLVHVRTENFAYALAYSAIYRIFVGLPDNPAGWNAYLRAAADAEVSLRTPEGDKALGNFTATLRAKKSPAPLSAAFDGLRSLVKRSGVL
jgi:hypothetical protein